MLPEEFLISFFAGMVFLVLVVDCSLDGVLVIVFSLDGLAD
jgi:hypothetical protein